MATKKEAKDEEKAEIEAERQEIVIPEWLANKKGYESMTIKGVTKLCEKGVGNAEYEEDDSVTQTKIQGFKKGETEKAILLEDEYNREIWFPKSQIEEIKEIDETEWEKKEKKRRKKIENELEEIKGKTNPSTGRKYTEKIVSQMKEILIEEEAKEIELEDKTIEVSPSVIREILKQKDHLVEDL